MKNQTIQEIQNEVLELAQKIESVKNNLTELQKTESQKPFLDFATFMKWADTYFTEKVNIYSISSDMDCQLDIDDHCTIDLSLSCNEIEIEKEWKNTEDIVSVVLELTKMDFLNFMTEEFNNI